MRTAFFLKLSIIMLFSANIFAHTPLKSSTPSNGDILKKSPTALILNFREGVTLAKVELHKKNGEKIEINFTPSGKKSADYSISLPNLMIGSYQVDWVAIGADTHKIEGSFGFAIQVMANTTEAENTQATATDDHSHH